MLKTFSFLAAAGLAAGLVAVAASGSKAVAESTPPALSEINLSSASSTPITDTDCASAPFQQAAQRNGASRTSLAWSPFGRAERGWAIYEKHVAQDIGTACNPGDPGFAAALAHWQEGHQLPANGEATVQTLTLLKTAWQDARPYVALRATGVCPDAPSEAQLTTLTRDEGYMGKSIQLKAEVADAYRRMVAAARAEVPELAADPQMLVIFSGFRSPAYDAARCARDHNCGGAERATCSVHRTGGAFDLVVGAAPGYAVDSSADPNRLYQSQTPAYRWLVANAARFGFINYAFEPWHWEYVGAASTQNQVATIADSAR